MKKVDLKTSLSLSKEVVVVGCISSSQDGVVVDRGGGIADTHCRTRQLSEGTGDYRELNRRMYVSAVLPAPSIQDMRMLLSKTISV